jgi:hypothetical protein
MVENTAIEPITAKRKLQPLLYPIVLGIDVAVLEARVDVAGFKLGVAVLEVEMAALGVWRQESGPSSGK